MASPTHVTVTAPEGRQTPVHSADGTEPGGGTLFVTSDTVCRVRYTQTTIRSIARGDLVLCNAGGTAVTSVANAASPFELEGGKINLAERRAASSAKKGA